MKLFGQLVFGSLLGAVLVAVFGNGALWSSGDCVFANYPGARLALAACHVRVINTFNSDVAMPVEGATP